MDFEYIQAQIRELTPLQGITFAAALCERMFPTYVSFSQARRWGKSELLRQGIDQCWSFVYGRPIKASAAERMIEQISTVTPDSDDFGDFDATLAQHAAISILTCLEILVEYDTEKVISISEYSRDNVDAYLYEIYTDEATNVAVIQASNDFDTWKHDSDLMKKEFEIQRSLADQIKSIYQITDDSINMLKALAAEGKIDLESSKMFPLDRTRVWTDQSDE